MFKEELLGMSVYICWKRQTVEEEEEKLPRKERSWLNQHEFTVLNSLLVAS